MGGTDAIWRLLAGTALAPLSVTAAWAADQDSAPPAPLGEIIVYGERPVDIFAGIVAETELDENDIAAYGFDTIRELIEQVGSEAAGSADGPVVLVNGRLANGINDIADLPSEAVSRVQILPRQAGPRVGQSASRRVINVVIKPDLRQVTGNSSARLSTRGDAFAIEGEANLLRVNAGNRATLALRARHADPLLESQRGIVTDTSGTPFGFIGNVVSFPSPGAEIDPALSAAAGALITVAGVPDGPGIPTLAAFAANGNRANLGDFGRFRSLMGESESYSANGNLTRRLNPDTTLSLTARLERTLGQSLTGAATTMFRVPGGSPFSPFGTDVLVARAFGDPLEQRQRATTLTLGETLSTQVGKIALSLLASLNHRVSRTESERDFDVAALQAEFVSGARNPFATVDANALGALRRDRARSRSDNGLAQAIASAGLFALPAGEARATAQVGYRADRQSSRTTGRTINVSRFFERNERNAQLNLQLPLFGGAADVGLGDLSLDLSGAVRKITSAPTLNDYGGALTWDPDDWLNLRVARYVEETAPPASALNDPIVVIDSFRTFDFVRQETVLVRYLTGGNPALPVMRRTRTVVGGTFAPFADNQLRLNAEYERLVGRNAFAALPPADARVQLAFPDRYVRDANGVLIQLDARPVAYERDLSELLRWGIDFKRTFGGTMSVSEAEGIDNESRVTAGRGWRVNFNADHTWFLENTRLPRRGLPLVDLLDGGALGFGGGQPRHSVRFTGAVYHAGIGLQLNGDYRSRSKIRAGTLAAPDDIVFAGRALINARLFVNLGPQFPESVLAKGARVSLAVANLFDSKQRVRDSSGSTPLRYQPFLLDPLGRALTLSLRKVF